MRLNIIDKNKLNFERRFIFMYADVNEENERMVDDFFNSKKPKAYLLI
ncbi:hypothetical protein H477_5901 [[Clostridium] sordellii ATCC 9714]|nr:hypothetical protein H477_5901 [[Clostridium] sordellii ATCC 9714] [Paeniclostridium sordellii ATCC 9714]